ncbi:MAG TPA: HEAT repeat domain-containing protein [Bacteroidota bacterium]|nr:HEAT repeat domain-containing protein [Bacteroidota bacterium]
MIPALTTQLTSEDPDIRRAAIEQLQYNEPDLSTVPIVVQMLMDGSSGVRDAAANTLRGWKSAQVASAIAPLITHRQAVVRNLAGELLVFMGTDAVECLLPYCHVNDVDTQKFAIDVLGLIGDPSIAPHLFRVMEYKDNNVAYAGVEAMGNCHVAEAVEKLKDLYERREILRHVIIESLGKIGSRESLEFLFMHFHDEDPLIRFAVLEALGTVGDAAVIPTLIEFVGQQKEPNLRRMALQSLIELVKKSGVLPAFPNGFEINLVSVVKEDGGRQYPWAVEALMWFTGEEVCAALEKALGASPALDEQLVNYFYREPDKAFTAALTNLARNEDPPLVVLQLVYNALSQFNSKIYNNLLLTVSYEDFDRLVEFVERQWYNPDPEMRRFVLDNLFKVDGDRAMDHLQEMANDTEPWNKMHAIELVETIEDPRIPGLLAALANDEDDLVRDMAVAQLQRRQSNAVSSTLVN